MRTSKAQRISNLHRLLSPMVVVFGILIAAPALAEIVYDRTMASCGYQYTPHDYNFVTNETPPNTSATCADVRFGQISSSASINGTALGGYVGIDWNANPPTAVPPNNDYTGTTLTLMLDNMTVAGSGTGTMTFTVPVHGTIVETAYFSLLASLVIQVNDNGGSQFSVWQQYFENGVVDQTFTFLLSVPLGQSFQLASQLQIWGGGITGSGSYFDAYADFRNTAEVTITGLQDATGADIPLTALQVAGGRQYTTAAVVPEPETYAMLLAGLGLLGLAARRRKQQAA